MTPSGTGGGQHRPVRAERDDVHAIPRREIRARERPPRHDPGDSVSRATATEFPLGLSRASRTPRIGSTTCLFPRPATRRVQPRLHPSSPTLARRRRHRARSQERCSSAEDAQFGRRPRIPDPRRPVLAVGQDPSPGPAEGRRRARRPRGRPALRSRCLDPSSRLSRVPSLLEVKTYKPLGLNSIVWSWSRCPVGIAISSPRLTAMSKMRAVPSALAVPTN